MRVLLCATLLLTSCAELRRVHDPIVQCSFVDLRCWESAK